MGALQEIKLHSKPSKICKNLHILIVEQYRLYKKAGRRLLDDRPCELNSSQHIEILHQFYFNRPQAHLASRPRPPTGPRLILLA